MTDEEKELLLRYQQYTRKRNMIIATIIIVAITISLVLGFYFFGKNKNETVKKENVEVLPPTTNRDKAKSTDNILIGTTTSGKGRKLFHGIKPKSKQTDKTKEINTDKTVMKKNKEQTVTETVKQNETKENHAKKKFDAYMEFKKQYPDCSKDDFEIYYSMLNEGVDDNEKNKEEN